MCTGAADRLYNGGQPTILKLFKDLSILYSECFDFTTYAFSTRNRFNYQTKKMRIFFGFTQRASQRNTDNREIYFCNYIPIQFSILVYQKKCLTVLRLESFFVGSDCDPLRTDKN